MRAGGRAFIVGGDAAFSVMPASTAKVPELKPGIPPAYLVNIWVSF